jgi:O-antigen ligase
LPSKRLAKPTEKSNGPSARWAWTLGAILALVPLFEGGNDVPAYVLAFVVAIPAAAFLLWKSKRRLDLLDAAVFLFLVYAFVAAFFSMEKYRSLVWALNFAAFAAAYAIAREVGRRSAVPVLGGAAVGVACVSLYGLWLFWGSGEPSYRVVSTFGLHNPIAGFYLVTLPVVTALAITAADGRARLAWWVILALGLVSLVLTYSRAGWLVGIVEGIVFLAVLGVTTLRGASAKRILVVVGAPVGLLVVIGAFVRLALPGAFKSLATHASTITNSQDYSLLGRKVFDGIALKIFAAHPMFGTGFDTYRYAMNRFQTDFRFYSTDPHNLYLQMLAEGGIVAGIIFALLFVCVAVSLIRAAKSRDIVAIGIAAGVFGLLLHLAVDFDITYVANGLLLLAFIGLLATPVVPLRHTPSALLKYFMIAALAFAFVFSLPYTREQTLKNRISPLTADSDRIPILKAMLAVMPWNHDVWLDLAGVDLRYDAVRHESLTPDQLGQGDELVEDADAAVRRGYAICPEDARANYMMAFMMNKKGKSADAVPFLRTAMKLDPVMHPEYYEMLGEILRSEWKLPECKEVLLTGIKNIPVEYPVTPDFVRPEWVSKNVVFYRTYYLLSLVSSLMGDAQGRDKYWEITKRFLPYADVGEPEP